MSIPFFIGLAAVLFILGILCIIKGASSQESDVVSISSTEEVEELKDSFTSSEEDGMLNPQIKISPKSEMTELTQKNEQSEQNFSALNQENQNVENSQIEKIKALEEKIASMTKEREELLPNRELINDLKARGELFEKQYAENKTQQEELRKTICTLEAEKEGLLGSQKSGVDQSELDAIGSRLENSIATIEALKEENRDLQKSNQDLKDDYKKAQEQSAHLAEKEKIMEYELSKNRAQTVGLEKICEGFKLQIESLTAVASDK